MATTTAAPSASHSRLRWLLALLCATLTLTAALGGCGADTGDADPVTSRDTSSSSGGDAGDTAGSSGTDQDGTSGGDAGDTSGTSGSTSGSTSGTTSGDTSGTPVTDSDDDGISDADEGAPTADTDGDGTPDYLDPDSDNDGVADRIEAGDANPATPPVDSDGDGAPDFRDPDSDSPTNDSVPDSVEGGDDPDGDGIPNAADRDNDGDGVMDAAEITGQASTCVGGGAGSVAAPLDFDGDGTPDYLDTDSDGDTLGDLYEGSADTDSDGCPDRYDSDSDNDGIPDRDEAGPGPAPRDTDLDGVPDFRDPDADGDGLSDRAERETYNTDPFNADSDNDGVTDLIEVAAGTDPNSAADSPRTRGDFFFLIPHQAAPDPTVDTLAFRTNFQQADVYFLIDNSGSMGPEITAMRDAVVGIVTDLTCQSSGVACSGDGECAAGQACSVAGVCIEDPATSGCIPSFWTGAGVYAGADITTGAIATSLRSMTADPALTTSALPTTAAGGGALEGLFRAIECMATGNNAGRCPANQIAGCAASGIGCPGFRADAARILVTITDEPNQDTDTRFTAANTGTALRNAGVSFIGVDAARSEPQTFTACTNTCTYDFDGDCDDGGPNSDFSLCAFGTDCGDCGTRTMSQFSPYNGDLTAVANAAGSVDASGQPFVRAGDATLAVTTVVAAINEIINNIPVRVTIEAAEVAGDDGDALPFLDYLVVNTSGTATCENVSPVEDTDGDTRPDAFPSLRPGRRVCWDVYPKRNDIRPPTDAPQVFQLLLTVRGGDAILDQRRVYFLIPPRPAVIN